MGYKTSLRNKAAHFVSDLTAVILSPISDEPSNPHEANDKAESNTPDQLVDEGESEVRAHGPDTSSFSAFLYSLLSSPERRKHLDGQENGSSGETDSTIEDKVGRKSLFALGKQSAKKVMHHAARMAGYRDQNTQKDSDDKTRSHGFEMGSPQVPKGTLTHSSLPDMSEPSLLLSTSARRSLYSSLPVLIQERKWILLYSTWRHGISLSTLYRRSVLCPGFCLLVVGDRMGVVFGGLIEAPLRPSNKRKYQGTVNSFVFTNRSSQLVVYRPTGANRYFTFCSIDFLALGGGGHFALYLDGDLLNGSSAASDTFGNSCLAYSQDFEVKEVELWGFAYGSKYEETLALCRTETPGICRW